MPIRNRIPKLTISSSPKPVSVEGTGSCPADSDVFDHLRQWYAHLPPATPSLFLTACAACFLSYGFMFANLSLNHDGFGFITTDSSAARATGRWLTDVLYIHVLGGFELIWLNGILATVLFVWAGFVICQTLRIERLCSRLACVLLFTLFPFMCNFYGYAFHVPIYAFSCLLACLGVEIAGRPRFAMVALACVLIMASLACYQAFFSSAVTLTLLSASLELARARSSPDIRDSAFSLARRIGAVAAGGLLYILSVKASVAFFGVSLGSYQRADDILGISGISLESFRSGMRAVVAGSWQFLGIPVPGWTNPREVSPYFGPLARTLVLLVCAGALAAIWTTARARWTKFGAVALLSLAFLAPRSLQAIHPGANYHELTLIGYGVYIAAAGALSLSVSNRHLRSGFQVLVLILIATFIHSNNVGASALVFDYQAIMHWANRVLDRVEQHPRYHEHGNLALRRVVFVGDLYSVSNWFYRGRPFVSAVGIADGVPNIIFDSLFRLLRSNVTSDGVPPDSRRQAIRYALTHDPWPHRDSVTILDDGTIVVVLGRPPSDEDESVPAEGITALIPRSLHPPVYSLDRICDVVSPLGKPPVRVKREGDLRLSGFAVDHVNKRSPGGVEISIAGKTYRAVHNLPRPDVANYFRLAAYANSGFRFRMPARMLPAGTLRLSIRVLSYDRSQYTESPEFTIVVE